MTSKPSKIGYFKKPQWPIEMTPMGYGYALDTATYRGMTIFVHTCTPVSSGKVVVSYRFQPQRFFHQISKMYKQNYSMAIVL